MKSLAFGILGMVVGIVMMIHGTLKGRTSRAALALSAKRARQNEATLAAWRANRPSEETIAQWWKENKPG